MPSVKAPYKLFVLLVLLLLPVNCSVEKNTGATRLYHGLTARYNIYFNGSESFKAGLQKIAARYSDNYSELLRVFEFSDPSTVSVSRTDMDVAIQKASKVISLKSITAKPEGQDKISEIEADLLNRKEYNEWVDDSYLLIGKARFYKHEFDEAEAVFNHCINEANDSLIKKEAAIWLARVYNETGDYRDAYRVLNELEITRKSKKPLRAMYYTTLADHYIKQKKYPEATEPLATAKGLVAGKRARYRLTYLLAQLNEYSGNASKAISLYRDVVRMNPPYEVEFNARINIAGVFDVNAGNPGGVRRELQKMLRNSKNKEFLDQIYFALANLSMKEGNTKEALDFYRKSASSSTENRNQKGRSYLALADYYYGKPDFLQAGKFYDSTVFFLDQSHPEYQSLRAKSQNLNSVVSHLTIIQTEDSLQRVAAMSENERNAFITSIINEITQAENEGRVSQYADRFNLGQYYENEMRFQDNIEQEGRWYFYNQSALTFGRTEFRRRYGDRRLEDNWRRSNKASIAAEQISSGAENGDQTGSDTSLATLDYKKPEFYLRNLPLNDSLLALSNEKIANAYLNAGKAFAEKIIDLPKASESFENLVTRYPSHELVPEALYHLYRLNSSINKTKAETYRQRLLEKYPSTEFSRILSDPEYYQKKLAEIKMAEMLYQDAYKAFTEENFSHAVTLCDEGLTKYSENDLAPKFQLLRAYSVARASDERTFKEELNKLVRAWPESEESKRAGEIIAYLDKKLPELKLEEEKVIVKELFRADTTHNHLFSLIINDPLFNINQATFDVISYNIDNYTNKNYRTEGSLINNNFIMINVSGFTSFQQAMDYYLAFGKGDFVRNPSGVRMFSYIISTENLGLLGKDNTPERYLIFFEDNFLK
ncbi:MAG: hypothetical protein JXN62_04515 [Bacteroidales bacterium]|nr:hypothetical protein [Bacteroidales bacterium]